ncbi:MAG: class I SAM-dependent methyltransferase [Hyphomicrobium sp.]|jgi:cyclopropane fatty-acyl-phospholipid synthase-like methyltransferase
MAPGETSIEAASEPPALEIFQNQWEVYRKFLVHDYLSNGKASRVLRRFLTDEVKRPFRVLDLACGDSSNVVAALEGLPVEHYCGVDLSAPALTFAQRNLAPLTCPVELVEADFTSVLGDGVRTGDIVWISLSLHHLDATDKLAFMNQVHANMKSDGAFLIYEPTLRQGEDRPAYLDRLEDVGRREWTELSSREFSEAINHVRTCDLPETKSDWEAMGRDAGFSKFSELYASHDDLFRLFLYRP